MQPGYLCSPSRTAPGASTPIAARFGCDETQARALLGAAVRETFEETGVLLSLPAADLSGARTDVEAGRVSFGDLLRANGLVVDGGLVQRVRVIPGQKITIGATEVSFSLVPRAVTDDSLVLERGGALMFNRSPRVEDRYAGREFRHPIIPNEADPRIFPWPMIMAPVLLGQHYDYDCPSCHFRFALGIDEQGRSGRAACPNCGRLEWGQTPVMEGAGDRLLEVHLFDREVALYGRRLCCAFIERLRAEARFATIEDLKAQIDRDCAAARAALAAAAA